MRLVRLLFPLFLLPLAAQCQGVFYNSDVTTSAANVPAGASAPILTLPGAIVTVCGYPGTPATGSPCTNTVSLFSDQFLTVPLANPITADQKGRFQFWVAPNLLSYSIQTQSGIFQGNFPLSLSSIPGPAGPSGAFTQAGFLSAAAYTGTFPQMVVDASTANSTITISYTTPLPNGTTTVSADRAIVALAGGQFTCPTGTCTLAFSGGDFTAPTNRQAFGSNVVVTGLKKIYPEWFGGSSFGPSIINSLSSAGGTVYLTGTYTSGFTTASGVVLTKDNVTVIGANMPDYNSLTSPTALAGGTIIKGGVEVGGSNNFNISNVGFDVGSDYIAAGGAEGDALSINGLSGGTNLSDPLVVNNHASNIITLLDTQIAPFHGFLLEHNKGSSANNIQTYFGAHGVVYKSIDSTISNTYSRNCQSECFDVKADAYTATSNGQISNVKIVSTIAGAQGNGFNIDAENGGTLSNIQANQIQIENANIGITLLDDSTTGGGINNVSMSNVLVLEDQNVAGTPKCVVSAGASGTTPFSNIQFNNFQCIGSPTLVPIALPLPITNLSLNNWTTIGTTSASSVSGTIQVNGFNDLAPGNTATAFGISGAGTVFTMYGYFGNRAGAAIYATDGLATVNISPSVTHLTDAGGFVAASGVSGGTAFNVQNAAHTENLMTVLDSGITDFPSGQVNIQNSEACTFVNGCNLFTASTPATQVVCIKVAGSIGPPLIAPIFGTCSTVIGSTGACTCN